MVCPTGLEGFQIFFNGLPNGCGGVSDFFQWSAQRVWRGFRFFSMVCPTGLEGFQIFSMVCPTSLEGFQIFFNGLPNGSGGVSDFFQWSAQRGN